MPVFSFFCEQDHETERFTTAARRPDAIECGVCADVAYYRLSVSKHQGLSAVVAPRGVKVEDSRGMALHEFWCKHCDHRFDDITDWGEGEDPNDGRVCEECGELATYLPGCSIDRFSERFPYYDNGLGMWLTSKAHRKEVCKAKGLTPVEGDWDVEKEFRKWDDKTRAHETFYNDYKDKIENDPAFSTLRRAMDRGEF